MEDRRGERFGRYEILAELGRGAMGIVYKARDPKINRVVAIKTFSLAGQPEEEEQEYRERFFREAEAAGRLSHPGIVTVFDVGEEPETRSPYIVMEFVGGRSLDKILAGNDHKLPLDTALQLAHELAEALDCAHGQGVVHRDLKPANILITEEGHAKIADFGVAKLNLASHTLGGRALGTPAYMSPEQLEGETVDGRSDLFSLGVVLYTVLTGYRPFQGNSAMTVSFKVVNRDPIPATVLETELPPGLDYIISRAMAKDPAQRYQRGMEMALDIQDLREGRELWSKAKQPNSPAVSASSSEKSKSASHLVTSTRIRSTAPLKKQANRFPETMLEKMRKQSFVGAALVAGLMLFAFRLSPFVWPRQERSGATMDRGVNSPQFTAEQRRENAVGANPMVSSSPAMPTAAVAPSATVGRKSRAARNTPLPAAKVAASAPATVQAVSSVPKAAEFATLEIEVEHAFPQANLSIWVDGTLSYTHGLEGSDKKHLVVFHRVKGHEFHAVQIPAGSHELRVQVQSEPGSTSHSASITGEFGAGTEKMLQIHFDKRGEMNLRLQ